MFGFAVVLGVGNKPESVLASADKPQTLPGVPRTLITQLLCTTAERGSPGRGGKEAARSNVDWSDSLLLDC